MRQTKYIYLKVLQEWTGEEYADSVYYDTREKEDMADLRRDIKSYREEGIRVRTIQRRVLRGTDIHL